MHDDSSMHVCQDIPNRHPADYIAPILYLHVSMPMSLGIVPSSPLEGKLIAHAAPVQFWLHDQDSVRPVLVKNVSVSTPAQTTGTVHRIQVQQFPDPHQGMFGALLRVLLGQHKGTGQLIFTNQHF